MDQIQKVIKEVEDLKAKKEFSEALKRLELALTTHSDDYRLYEEIADIYIYKGNFEKAKKAINFALDINPDSATGNYLKGFMLLSRDKVYSSIRFLEKSNILSPNNPEVLRNLGWAHTMNGDFDKGIFILKRALNLAPGDDLIMEDLAMAYINMGDIKRGNILLSQIKNK